MAGPDPVFSLIARFAIALVFAGALRHKLRDLLRFEGIVADYRLAPERGSFLIARGLVVLEGVIVAGLLVPAAARAAAAAAGVVLSAYGIAIGVNLARGRREIECGCGGHGERLRPRLLVRNAALVGVCAVAATSPADRVLAPLDFLTIGIAVGSLVLLWQAASGLSGLRGSDAVAEWSAP